MWGYETPPASAPPPPPPPAAPPPGPPPEKRGRGAIIGVGALVAGIIAYLLLRPKLEDAAESIKETVASAGGEGQKKYMPLVIDAANAANIPPSILAGIVTAESSWSNAGSSSACGTKCHTGPPDAAGVCAIGLAQVKPPTARDMGVTGDLCIPANSLLAGAKYLRLLYTLWRAKLPSGTPEADIWRLAARSYNAGRGNVDKWIAQGLVNPNDGTNVVPAVPGTFRSRNAAYANKALRWADTFHGQGIAGLGVAAVRPVRVSLFGLRAHA